MGVPAFFRWLSKKYPDIVEYAIEDSAICIDGKRTSVDTTKPNPNRVEFDNLYLDMNGIIHPCCHPENKAAPKNEYEMMIAIFEYIDRLFRIIRPRKLLYMAVDGVAPRAKMNQQRSRRFRSAKENLEHSQKKDEILSKLETSGVNIEKFAKGESFDSNCITPGTEFMSRLSQYLQYYVIKRIGENAAWANIEVILSDASVPGEGEHKIMDYIRSQRSQPTYNPNLQHCLNGADADLIMLGLALHEVNFTIIREEFRYGLPTPCKICSQLGHEMSDCTGKAEGANEQDDVGIVKENFSAEAIFIFIKLANLREHLLEDLAIRPVPGFQFDLERCIDDWVFLCFFVGNDFLPHLPSLQIREGAINRLVSIYKRILENHKLYLTDAGYLNLSGVEILLREIGVLEDGIFKKRRDNDLRYRDLKKRGVFDKKKGHNSVPSNIEKLNKCTSSGMLTSLKSSTTSGPAQMSSNARAADKLKSMLTDLRNNDEEVGKKRKSESGCTEFKATRDHTPTKTPKLSESQDNLDSDEEMDRSNNIRLWEGGWRDRYYINKFKVECSDQTFVSTVSREYIIGLSWVLLYYYQGCSSWDWYYPFHYAPFASDFGRVEGIDITFPRDTKPVRPIEQLMSVFPAGSSKFIPPAFANLMMDADSPILDFYPINFRVDLNGKKFEWQGVALLPFVEKSRLMDALVEPYKTLTTDEKTRNCFRHDIIFVGPKHPSFKYMIRFLEINQNEIEMNPSLIGGSTGVLITNSLNIVPNGFFTSPDERLANLENIQLVGLYHKLLPQIPNTIFQSRVLPGAIIPKKSASFRSTRGSRGRYDTRVASRLIRNALPRDDYYRNQQNDRQNSRYSQNSNNYDRRQNSSFDNSRIQNNYQHGGRNDQSVVRRSSNNYRYRNNRDTNRRY